MTRYGLILLFLLAACKKEIQQKAEEQPLLNCDVREIKGKVSPHRLESGTTYVIYLNFDGGTLPQTYWANGGALTFDPAKGLSPIQRDSITQYVKDLYSPFDVAVTTDKSQYDAANTFGRMMCAFTDSYEWYGNSAGGTSYINSYNWGDGSPCFVFSGLLKNRTRDIAFAGAHELGHTFGLRHQSLFDASGNKLDDYHPGFGTGDLSACIIMGRPYFRHIPVWFEGYDSYHTIQNDYAKLQRAVGLAADDYPDTATYTRSALLKDFNGILHSGSDVDVVPVNFTQAVVISATSDCADLKLTALDKLKQPLATANDPLTTSASLSILPAGEYFLKIEGVTNPNMDKKYMTGPYHVKFTPASVLPIALSSFDAVRTGDNTIRVSFESYNAELSEKYVIQTNTNGKWVDKKVIAPRNGKIVEDVAY